MHLTPTEYELLRAFVAHPDKVLTDRMLLQAVWGPEYGSEAHYLHVYIAPPAQEDRGGPAAAPAPRDRARRRLPAGHRRELAARPPRDVEPLLSEVALPCYCAVEPPVDNQSMNDGEQRILLVEDEPTLRSIIARNLTARGCEVREAATATKRSAARRRRRTSCCSTSTSRTARGWDVLRHLKRRGHEMPTVIVSAVRVSPERLAEFKPLAYLPKPFPIEALLRMVAAASKLPNRGGGPMLDVLFMIGAVRVLRIAAALRLRALRPGWREVMTDGIHHRRRHCRAGRSVPVLRTDLAGEVLGD